MTPSWEIIGTDATTERLWIPTGWLLRIIEVHAVDHKSGCDPSVCYTTDYETSYHIVQIDDPDHIWDSLQQVQGALK